MAQAEEILVQYYSGDQVAFQLRALMGIRSFRPRMRLAGLALTDYREGRYHACVPVVLALLDGRRKGIRRIRIDWRLGNRVDR